jgi:hypothetical protein
MGRGCRNIGMRNEGKNQTRESYAYRDMALFVLSDISVLYLFFFILLAYNE